MTHPAPYPADERNRIARLRALAILDTPPEAMFDVLVQVAANVCGVPISLVSLVDSDRQWFKANVGLSEASETPRDVAFCSHTILGDEVMEVHDALNDWRFVNNPLVTDEPRIRFYAGAPLKLSDGTRLGTLCVIDRQPHRLTEHQRATLASLACAVVQGLEFREQAMRAVETLAASEARLERLYSATPGMLHSIDAQGRLTAVSDHWLSELGYRRDEVIGRYSSEFLTPESQVYATRDVLPNFFKTGRCDEIGYQIVRKDGSVMDVLLSAVLERDASGNPLQSLAVITNITEKKRAEASLVEHAKFTRSILENVLDGIITIDASGIIHSMNPEAARIFGYTEDEAIGQNVKMLMPESDAKDHDDHLRSHHVTGVSKVIGTGRELNGRRKNGASFPMELAVSRCDQLGQPLFVGVMQDISERKEMERRLVEGRELLQVTLDSIGDAVITTDVNSCIQWLNPVAERLTGWSKEDAYRRPLAEIFVILNKDSRLPAQSPVSLCLQLGEVTGLANDTVLIARNGSEYGIEDSASPIRDARGSVHGAVLVFHDVSEQRRLTEEMSHRARHDTLTGLLNRLEFESRLVRMLAAAKEGHGSGALMYIDLDQFKLVNDACGHAVGDQLLRQVSALMQSSVRGRDTVARLGGDEFGILLEHCSPEAAERIAAKICEQMEDFRFLHDGRRYRVGTSIGLVSVDERWANTALTLQAADAACYAAKEAGRNRVHTWFDTDRAMKTRQGEMKWVTRLEQALDEDRFELYGQRIVPIGRASTPLHFEVLLRLRESDGTLVPPGIFLPAAERFHMATRIDRWVVRHTFEWLAQAVEREVKIELVAINLSGQSIGDRAFHQHLFEMIRHARFDLRKVCFEITETAAITNLVDARQFVDEVRRLGAKVALDDFGAGASSFGYLKNLIVDFLKIDGQFITDMLEDKLDEAAVRCFNEVARVAGVTTIAEFVERQDVLEALHGIGINMAQGYLIHRPEPLESLVANSVRV
ncbi:PAS domain S-box protein [Zoogloea sp.]|jgi:diguanylate cyclase (GGDEF)-like protein/PAS domain S-box-containing protein|uniref:PAS domain S-box protein n=1 Tax=Zoogloea sp. TaxID=49181 RepID=UPI0037DA0DAF